MTSMVKYFWLGLGFVCLVIAYIGVVTPGIPFSPFLVGSACCFAKSSPKMHAWLYNHKLFGKFLTNWTEKRIMPTKMKYMMVAVMISSLVIMWFTTHNIRAIMYSGTFMFLVAVWAWRYPGSIEEWTRRQSNRKN